MGDNLAEHVGADVANTRHRPDLGDQRLADAVDLALGRVAQLDVEGHVGAAHAQVLDPRDAT
jgi:hypothetical protein